MQKADVLKALADNGVKYLRLQFTDIVGLNKNVEVPESQFDKAIDGNILFDGSSLEGSVRVEECDMLLKPDLDTLLIFPWDEGAGQMARLICDTYTLDRKPYDGCPRLALKRVVQQAREMGFETAVGPEVEFFIFKRDAENLPVVRTHDPGGYFDLAPVDTSETLRRAITEELIRLGFVVESAHHEVAHGQHEIDFKHADALTTADNLMTFKFVARKVASRYGYHVTFMPKPVYGVSGSGLHLHLSLSRGGENAFIGENAEHGLSTVAEQFVAGLLLHARGITAITNPLVNSYKRLVPGYEAPTHITWSARNQSPLCRVSGRRGKSTRVEYRAPDPACNPYLALALVLAAGLEGVRDRLELGPPVNKNIFAMSQRERGRLKVGTLPENLDQALDQAKKDVLVRDTLGDTIYHSFMAAKRNEWESYISQVHAWELEHYLTTY